MRILDMIHRGPRLRVGLLAFSLFASLSTSVAGDDANRKAPAEWDRFKSNCQSGLYHQPVGPFAVSLYCEKSLGDYISVVYFDPIGAPATKNGQWTLDDRYWYAKLWGCDVTGFQWSKDGKKLVVSTSPIYGSGGLFELDLSSRTARQLLPKGKMLSNGTPSGPGYDIQGRELPVE